MSVFAAPGLRCPHLACTTLVLHDVVAASAARLLGQAVTVTVTLPQETTR